MLEQPVNRNTEASSPLQLNLFDAWTEDRLVKAALDLGAASVPHLSEMETALVGKREAEAQAGLVDLQCAIKRGEDPLGDIFCNLRTPSQRRPLGATYTPMAIVRQMVSSATQLGEPVRIVDPGCGSARFLVEAGRRFPDAELIGFEVDPLAALIGRAHLASAGFSGRATIKLEDYRSANLNKINGATLFVGNPPYVRHHLIDSDWKAWLASRASTLGLKASQLAGLHVHFFLATAIKGKAGDFGSFITSAEWLDVNYGSLVREMFIRSIGGTSITVIEPTAMPFPDAATTAAITEFSFGTKVDPIKLSRIETATQITSPEAVRHVRRERLESESRWSHLTRGLQDVPSDFVELGELCRVHRGAVTGANRIWIAGEHSQELPEEFLFSSITRAKELFGAGQEIVDVKQLKKVIDLPTDLDGLDKETRKIVDRFLRFAKSSGVDAGYVARARRAWWSVGLRKPAPILATYMARRSPAFVLNTAEARHINIAHGLYPRDNLDTSTLEALSRYLTSSVTTESGRTYAGGLTKFEPREMERLLVPRPEVIRSFVHC